MVFGLWLASSNWYLLHRYSIMFQIKSSGDLNGKSDN